MNLLSSILKHNDAFVEESRFVPYLTNKLPEKKFIVISCMDTRLVELLPLSMDFRNGDAILLKTGGGIVSHAQGSVMRAILVGIYELGAEEIFVVGHHDCGMGQVDANVMIENMKKNGITDQTLKTMEASGIDLKTWLSGFDSEDESIVNSVNIVKNHPLVKNVPVHGLIMDPDTGGLEVVVSGYENLVSI